MNNTERIQYLENQIVSLTEAQMNSLTWITVGKAFLCVAAVSTLWKILFPYIFGGFLGCAMWLSAPSKNKK